MTDFELIPADEAAKIEQIVGLTRQQLARRYGHAPHVLRGVHPKAHGCVDATFKVSESLDPAYRIGAFAQPGRVYRAVVRFSNAAALVGPDSTVDPKTGAIRHGSRGMAIKLMDVDGELAMPVDEPPTQDFLMVNSPVFAFANVDDYLALSQVLVDNKDDPTPFFARTKSPDPEIQKRAIASATIAARIGSSGNPPPFQPPPLSPLDNRYFSASPYLFGPDRAMKFSARPVAPKAGSPTDVSDPDYLRKALRERLTGADAAEVAFDFLAQVRDADSLAGKSDPDIENACFEWDEAKYPFVTVGTLTIPPQEFDTDDLRARCEGLVFTPWHALAVHRPLGGINRLRKAVYLASAQERGALRPPVAPSTSEGDGFFSKLLKMLGF